MENDGTEGRALGVQDGARVDATRLSISNSYDTAIIVADVGTMLTLVDVVVRDTAEQQSDGRYGRGINVQNDATLDAKRVSVSRSHDLGIFVTAGAVATLTDVAVRDTAAYASNGQSGGGVTAQDGASIEALRLLVATSRETGIATLYGAFHGREVVVEDTLQAACECPERAAGYGASVAGGTMTLDGFWISGSATCGVFVADQGGVSGALDLTRGRVEGGTIGACVQVAGYGVERLTEGVAYVDNETNLDSTTLPVPQPIEDL